MEQALIYSGVFISGAVVGSLVTFFICRNNAEKFKKAEEDMKAELAAYKAKAENLVSDVKAKIGG